LGLVCASLALLTACASGPSLSPTDAPPPRPVPASAADPVEVAFAPLRGTLVEPGSLQRPSLAVKIDNHVDARPHIGLNQTDIVFEELVEGGITRYVAVWHSRLPDELGPVRSIRPMDPDIISPLGGLVAYSGGQQHFVDMMMAAPVVNAVFDYDDTGLFHRADDRPSPHDVILRAGEYVSRYQDLPAPPVQFHYGGVDPLAAPEFAAVPTSAVVLRFSDARYPDWTWEPAAGVWLRGQEGAADIEASGAQVQATNVVTMRVGIDWSYGEVPRTVMVGSGEVWVSTGGRTAHGTWSKDAADSPIELVADDGSDLLLAPGNTWVELVPTDGSVEFVP
jgi:hypothetical protein